MSRRESQVFTGEATASAPKPRQLPPERPGPAGGKRDLNRRQKLSAIGKAGLELMLERGIERVTIDEICKRAGVAKGSFYRYFDGKPALVEAILEPLVEKARASLVRAEAQMKAAGSLMEALEVFGDIAIEVAPIFINEQGAIRLYLQESRGPAVGARAPVRALSDELRDRATAITAAAHVHDSLRKLPSAVTALAVIGAVEGLAFDFLNGNLEEDVITIAGTLLTMVMDGIGVNLDEID